MAEATGPQVVYEAVARLLGLPPGPAGSLQELAALLGQVG
jgi:hypothetical protein